MNYSRSHRKLLKQDNNNCLAINNDFLPEAIEIMSHWKHLQPITIDFYNNYSNEAWQLAMVYTGTYFLITNELVDFVRGIVGNESALEICCGLGALGRTLKIPFIDRKVCEIKEAKLVFDALRDTSSPINQDIKYPDDVEQLTAHQAFIKYNPQWVIGCYVTPKYNNKLKMGNMYGPQEEEFIKNANYIHCGSGINPVHTKKLINKLDHWIVEADWLICRSSHEAPAQMRIWTKNEIDFEKMPDHLEFEYYK